MKILIIGFQRSGTTLLRRLITMHPDVNRILHEHFLLATLKNKEKIKSYLKSQNVNIETQTWGDKTPYYPNIRKIPVSKYCQTWIDYFGKKARVVHVVRHPYDVAFSNNHKYPRQSFQRAIKIYQNAVQRAVEATLKMPQVITFKYEDLILNPETMVPKIYKFCGINHTVDFKKLMKKWENSKYQSFDTSRVFAYKGKKIPKFEHQLGDVVKNLNDWLGGIDYKL